MPNPDERIRDFRTAKHDDGTSTGNGVDFAIAEALQKLARSVDLLAARVERCEARIARVR